MLVVDSIHEAIYQYVKRFGIRPKYIYLGEVEYGTLVTETKDAVGIYVQHDANQQNGKNYVLQLEIVQVQNTNWLKVGE